MILTHRPTGISAQASERRTQGENRRTALHRLRLELALTVRRPIREQRGAIVFRQPALATSGVAAAGIDVNPRHDDFPALLAEALDVLFACDDDPKAAALLLGCSPTQLIRFLKEAPRAIGVDQRTSPSSRAASPAVTKGMPPAGAAVLSATSGCARSLAGKETQRSSELYRASCTPGLCREGGQLLGGQLLERSSLALQSRLEPQGDFVEFWRVDHRGQLGQLDGVQVAQSLPPPLELALHPQRGLLQLGMGLGRAAKDQGLVASGQTLLVVTVVKTKSDEGGAEAARSWVGLLHENHRAVDLSRVGCRNRWPDRAGHCENRRIGRARHAIVLSDSLRPSNSTGRENRIRAADVTGNALTIRPGIPLRPCEQRDMRL